MNLNVFLFTMTSILGCDHTCIYFNVIRYIILFYYLICTCTYMYMHDYRYVCTYVYIYVLQASGGTDKQIHIWNAITSLHVHTFRGHKDAVSVSL